MSDYIRREDALNIDFRITMLPRESRFKTAVRAVQAYVDRIAALPTADVVEREKVEWKCEMPSEDGWYWVKTDFFNGHTEILPCYYKAKYNEMQSIDDGIACEIVGVVAVARMGFPNCGADTRKGGES